MFHTFPNLDAATKLACGPTSLHAFVEGHLDALTNAASLLAGQQGTRLVGELADRLSDRSVIDPGALKIARGVLDILSLEHVDDPEREEAAHFALIDPSDSRVEDICLLTDAFRRALETAASDQPPVLHLRPVA